MARFLTRDGEVKLCRTQRGMMLIDALISLLIISVSLTALLKLHWQVTRQSLETQMHNIALNLAQKKLTEIHNNAAVNYDLINSNNDSISLSYAKRPLEFKRQWQVQNVSSLDYKLITVSIRWKTRLSSRQLSLKTIIGKP